MKNKDKFPILKIINIKWNENSDKLPVSLELQWATQNWNFFDVSGWLSEKYNSTLNNLNIEQIGVKESSG
ncbi:MAG: hypothetical protein CMG07_06635 [Candidatus Marinimicrobia bacterium]|nr:hypothetical protein [Candidatus Neomarinimicrobiota bacterium]